MPLTGHQHEHIDTVLDRFDFDKVERVIHAERWKWVTPVGMQVPGAQHIQEEARATLRGAILHVARCPPTHFADFGSGGFEAIARLAPGTLDVVRLELRFVLAQGSSRGVDAADDE